MGGIASIMGGKKGGSSRPAPQPVVETKTKQEAPGVDQSTKGKRTNTRQRSQLVSGRPGAATRSGINVPGR